MTRLVGAITGKFARVLRWGRSGRRAPPRFAGPDFSLTGLVASFSPGHDLIDEASGALEAGETDRARVLLAGHFRDRRRPLFYLDRAAMRDAAERIATQHPAWKQGVVDRADSLINRMAPIYATAGPALSGDFDWAGLAPGPNSDKLHQVRLHRFAFAPMIALAHLHGAATGGALSKIIGRWMAEVGDGAHRAAYATTLIVIHRIVALSWAWAYLAGDAGGDPETETRLLQIIAADAHYLADRAGRSYPNNHLLADGFGLWYVATLFPEFAGADGWRDKGEAIWLRELARQIYADGTSFEHSLHYHELACEMTAGYVLLCRRNNIEPPQWVLGRLERMLAFQVRLAAPGARPPAIGDSAEDPLFPLDSEQAWGSGAWREILRSLFAPETTPAPAGDASAERAFWLLGGMRLKSVPKMAPVPGFSAFPDGGFYVFSQHEGRDRLIFRTGPAPHVASFPGHMHADLLSVYLSIGTTPVIAEAGTYTYRLPEKDAAADKTDWRRHYMGPAAHNGLAIAGVDPLGALSRDFRGRVLGTTVRIGRRKAGARLAWVEGENVGASAYAGHRRGVVHVHGHYWLYYDLLPEGLRSETASLGLQLGYGARVSHEGGKAVRVECGGSTLLIATDGLLPAAIAEGEEKPVAGWVSQSYGRHEPAPMLRFEFKDGCDRAVTVLLPADGEAAPVPEVTLVANDAGGLVVRVTYGEVEDLVVLTAAAGGGDRRREFAFDGSLLWLRRRDGAAAAIRWLDASRLSWPGEGIVVRSGARVAELDIAKSGAGLEVSAGGEHIDIEWPNTH